MTQETISQAANHLADVLCDIAIDLRTCDSSEWVNETDMLQATLNNIEFDYTQGDDIDRDMATLLGCQLKRLRIQDGDVLVGKIPSEFWSIETTDALTDAIRKSLEGKKASWILLNAAIDIEQLNEEPLLSLVKDAARYRWLRERDLDTICAGGVFAGLTPQNLVLNGTDLDDAVDSAIDIEKLNEEEMGKVGGGTC